MTAIWRVSLETLMGAYRITRSWEPPLPSMQVIKPLYEYWQWYGYSYAVWLIWTYSICYLFAWAFLALFLFVVILPPERTAECQSYKVSSESADPPRRNAKTDVSERPEKIINEWRYGSPSKNLLCHLQDMECNVPLVDKNNQEWVFTLYNFDNSGRVTKEVMAILATICMALKKKPYHSVSKFVCAGFYAVGYVHPDAYHLWSSGSIGQTDCTLWQQNTACQTNCNTFNIQ